MNKIYPFKFLDAYNKDDSGLFFGRDEEINTLYQMVFQTKILLVYGASGTGKTSLIQCGLASKFQSHDWLSLFIRRGNDLNESLKKILEDEAGKNEKIEGTIDLSSLDEDESKSSIVGVELSPLAKLFKSIYLNSFRPIYLIFDQFEELFIIGKKDEQDKFISTVLEIMRLDQPIKLIFCIREEFLGYLHNFEKSVPELLRKKLRVEPMNRYKVHQVIKGVTNSKLSNISILKGEEKAISDAIFDRIKGNDKTLAIQLPYLQVFMDKLYLHITDDKTRKADAVFSMAAMKQIGDIGDILREFLEEQVKEICDTLNDQYKKLTTNDIWKILSPFTTLEGTKEPISLTTLFERLPLTQRDLITKIVNAFVRSRILRFSEDGEIYELAHDTLAKQIASKRSDEEVEFLEVKQLIKNQLKQKKETRELFTERQLHRIDLIINSLELDSDEKKQINDSRKKIERVRLLKGLRNAGLLISLVIVIIIISIQWRRTNIAKEKALNTLAELAVSEKIAKQKTKDALEQKSIADKAKIAALDAQHKSILDAKNATEAKIKADSLRIIADSTSIEAKIQKQKAIEEAKNALRLKGQAESEKKAADIARYEANRLQLLSQSLNIAFKSLQIRQDTQLKANLAHLAYNMAIENHGNGQDPQIYSALSQALKSLDGRHYPVVQTLLGEPLSMRLSTDNLVYEFQNDGTLNKFNPGELNNITSTKLKGGPFTEAWINQACTKIISTNNQNKVWVHNLINNTSSSPNSSHTQEIRDISFNPNGTQIATAGRDSILTIFDNEKQLPLIKLPSRVRGIEFLDNKRIIIGCEDGKVYIHNFIDNNRTQIIDNSPARVQCISRSSQSKYIIIGFSKGQIQILDQNGNVINKIPERKSVDFISFNDESGMIAVALSNHVIHVYDIKDLSQKPLEINDISSRICGISLTSQGNLLVDCSYNSTNSLRTYNLNSKVLDGMVKAMTKKKLTNEEWNTYIGKDIPYKN